MTRKSPRRRTIACQDCLCVVENASPVQKYCKQCSAARHVETKRRWRSKNGRPDQTPEQKARSNAKKRADRDGLIERGARLSVENARGMSWYADSEPNPHSGFRVAVPFDYCMSKNGLWSNNKKGHVFIRKEMRSARDVISLAVKSAMNRDGWRLYTGKVWIDLLVQKPNHRGDAINVLDLICDAVKDAIGIDDRWFSIRRLDWEIVKRDPRIYIGVSQEITEDHRVCSCCGAARPLAMFAGSRRECAICIKVDSFTKEQTKDMERRARIRESASPSRTYKLESDDPGVIVEVSEMEAAHDS